MAETYLGNPLLKAPGVQIDFTKEQIEEYVKCAKDAKYFIETYIKIVNVDKGLVSFNQIETEKILGLKSDEISAALGYNRKPELIHRDNMAFFS